LRLEKYLKNMSENKNYHWSGIDTAGNKIAGEMAALNTDVVIKELAQKNIMPITIVLKKTPADKKYITFYEILKNRKIKTRDIVSFSKEFSALINANIPLVVALEIIGEDTTRNTNLRSVILNIKTQIEHGTSLTVAFKKHPQVFDTFFCNLINIGEKSGTLDLMLEQIANYEEKHEIQKRKIIKALLYPAVVLVIALFVAAILLIFVIPEFKEMYANFGAALPAYTQFIISLAEFIKNNGWFILVALVILVFSLRWSYKKFEIVIEKFHALQLHVPIFGKVLQKVYMARFARILAITFQAGLPILEALATTVEITKNRIYQKSVIRLGKEIEQGVAMHVALRKIKETPAIKKTELFSAKVVQFITIGEESGTLDNMLLEIAKFYENEVNYVTDNLNNLLEPIIMLILGVLVGGLVIGMYLPIFRLGTVI
jgi:type IV pilus assembly protein PilC